MAQEAQRELHARPLAAVTIVGDAHGGFSRGYSLAAILVEVRQNSKRKIW
jgi:hypothetical protein